MMKATRIGLAMLAVLALVGSAAAGAGTGRYEWRISFSDTDPNIQTAANFTTPGLGTLYLWYTGCNSVAAGPGMSAFEAALSCSGGWSFISFTPQNGYLNAAASPQLQLAVGSCPTGPVVAGSIALFATDEGSAQLGLSSNSIVVTVDCGSPVPIAWSWPDDMLIMGAKSNGFVGLLPGWGRGCLVDPVDAVTWGGIKAVYR